jgi:hypothetical protein
MFILATSVAMVVIAILRRGIRASPRRRLNHHEPPPLDGGGRIFGSPSRCDSSVVSEYIDPAAPGSNDSMPCATTATPLFRCVAEQTMC